MKTGRKITTLLLVLVLTLVMAVPAFANPGNATNGKITINNAIPGQTYTVYRIFDLDSYNKAEHAYLYKVNKQWKNFIEQVDISGVNGYVNVDDATGHVTWKKKDGSGGNAGEAEFAKLALAYAKNNNLRNAGSITAPDAVDGQKTTTVEFTNLPLGYYLVDSSLGALCALNTTDPDAVMTEKNGEPTIDKKVKEGDAFGEEASAQIGDTVTFKVTITAQAGAENYVLHDKMSDGLAFNGITSAIKNPGKPTEEKLDAGNDYTLTEPGTNGATFDMCFTKPVCDNLQPSDTIVVTYTATLTAAAAVGATNPNTNEAKLEYGNDSSTSTTPVQTKVYTYQLQLVKTDKGAGDKYNVLTGAKFRLYDAKTAGNEIEVVKDADGSYRIAAAGETGVDIEAGSPIIKGLDKRVYWLEETKAPDGFNKLTERIEVEITGDNLIAKDDLSQGIYTKPTNPTGIQIENHAGGMLPSTGGIGTVIFYILGAALVIGAIAMLVMRSRSVKDK